MKKTLLTIIAILISLLIKINSASAQFQLLKDIIPGSMNCYADWFIEYDSIMYFTANDFYHGYELWRSDGTDTGTYMVKDNFPGSNSYPGGNTMGACVLNNRLLFLGNDSIHGNELWSTDGTYNGTQMVIELYPGIGQGQGWPLQWLFPINDSVLFFAPDSANLHSQIWKTDGTFTGTSAIYTFSNGGPVGFTAIMNDVLYFSVGYFGMAQDELWRTDGTTAGTYLVAGLSSIYNASNYAVFDSVLYFTADSVDDGLPDDELWRSDGTTSGTYMLKDIRPGSVGSIPLGFTVIPSGVVFSANDSAHGKEPWFTDGTVNGTVMLKDIRSGIEGSLTGLSYLDWVNDWFPNRQVLNGSVFFGALAGSNPTTDEGLWKTDGTTAGTQLVYTGSFEMPQSAVYHDSIFVSTRFSATGREVWATDGTTAGTAIVQDANPGPLYFTNDITHFYVYADKLYVNGTINGVADGELFYLDHSVTTGVEVQTNLTEHFITYPNPTESDVYVKFNLLKNEKVRIRLLDQLGQIIMNKEIETHDGTNTQLLKLSNLTAGVYYLELQMESGVERSKLMLIK